MNTLTEIKLWLDMHTAALWWLGALSLIFFIGTLLIIPILVARIPVDYFVQPSGRTTTRQAGTHIISMIFKNSLGLLFILAGIAMLVLPGQGIITILIGIMLMNFPGKYRLERRIVQQPSVLQAINWLRQKSNKPALIL